MAENPEDPLDRYRLTTNKRAYIFTWGENRTNKSATPNDVVCDNKKDADTMVKLLIDLGFVISSVNENVRRAKFNNYLQETVIPECANASCVWLYFIVRKCGDWLVDQDNDPHDLFNVWEYFTQLSCPKLFFIQANIQDDQNDSHSTLFNVVPKAGSEGIAHPVRESTHNLLAYLPNISGATMSVADILDLELRKDLDINSALTSVIQKMHSFNHQISPKFSSTLTKLLYFGDEMTDVVKYCMSKGKKNLAYAFLMEKFPSKEEKMDLNSDKNVLEQLFKKLNFKAEYCVSEGCMKVSEFREKLQNILQDVEKLKSCDCIMIVISTHGLDTGTLFSDDGYFTVDDVWTSLAKCEALVGKPKVVIIDACRGQNFEVPNNWYADLKKRRSNPMMRHYVLMDKTLGNITKMKDVLIVQSSTEGTQSYQLQYGNSLFLYCLHKVSKNGGCRSFLTLLNAAMHELNEWFNHEVNECLSVRQQSTFTSTLTKILEFN